MGSINLLTQRKTGTVQMMVDAREYYKKTAAGTQTIITRLNRHAGIASWLRVAVFAFTVAGIALSWQENALAWGIAAIGITIFLITAKYHDSLLRQRAVQEVKKTFAERRLRVLDGDLSQQPKGERHIDPSHPFTYDLDVFGRCSLYSMLDSTATPMGAGMLAHWLCNPLHTAESISTRQQAVRELAGMTELRTALYTAGAALDGDVEGGKRPMPDLEQIPSFRLPLWQRIAAYTAAPVWLAVLILSIRDVLPGIAVMWITIINLIIAGTANSRVMKLHEWMTSSVSSLTARVNLFRHIENANFSSPLLTGLCESLESNGIPASRLIGEMASYLKSLDQRLNAAGFMIFNGTILWDLVIINKIDRWIGQHGSSLTRWQSVIGELDALSALATFSFENPDYVFADTDPNGTTIMKAEGLGHPLIRRDRRVDNPLPPMNGHKFMIITGANMAGKSTYLRTVGINYLLAMIGAPVSAKSMTFTPMHLFTGLRTTDSLADGESYFFAELRRLQAVVKKASQGHRLLILLDEILRGTNSADKQRGSLALVRKLVTLPVAGILATHDLALGALAEEYPDNVSAYCFEAEISGDNLTFDYRIRPGIARNLNAYFLMERMGIV